MKGAFFGPLTYIGPVRARVGIKDMANKHKMLWQLLISPIQYT